MGTLFRQKLIQEHEESNKAKYIRELQDLVLRVQPDYFVTLTFANIDVKEKFAIDNLKTWLKWVNQDIYGKRSKDRLEIFPFIEKNNSDGIHFHLLVKEPETNRNINIYDIFKKKWLKLSDSGHSSFRGYDTATGEMEWFKGIVDPSKLVEYLNKQTVEQRMDNLLVECMNYNI